MTMQMVPYIMRPFRETWPRFQVGWVFRFGRWEIYGPWNTSDLWRSENGDCPAIGLPVPPNPTRG